MKKNNIKRIALLIAIYSIAIVSVVAQETEFKPTVNFKGFSQMYFSYSDGNVENNAPYGFTLRRLRLSTYGTLTPNIDWCFQVAYDKQAYKLLDAYVNFKIQKYFGVKVGQFAPPAAKSAVIADKLYSTSKMLMIERPTVVQNWNGNSTLYAYRSFGVQIHGNLLADKLYYGIMASNPDAGDLYTPSVKNVVNKHTNNGLAIFGRLEFMPIEGIATGLFFSDINTELATNESEKRKSKGAHFFMRKNNISVLAEYIAGSIEQLDSKIKYNGFFADVAYNFNDLEPAIRYDFYIPNNGNADANGIKKQTNFTLGLNYYLNPSVKIQANYVVRNEDMETGFTDFDNNIFYIQLQYIFNSK